MPRTFPIRLEVEEIALGPLRKLNGMPGIVDLNLDLGHGGQGEGRIQLEEAAAKSRNGGVTNQDTIVKLLLEGPKHIEESSRVFEGKRSSVYAAASLLRKQGLVGAGAEKSKHQFTVKACTQISGARPALAAPHVKHGLTGRASPGSGNIVLRTALRGSARTLYDLRTQMSSKGMFEKNISGVLGRAQKKGLIRKSGRDYELTAKRGVKWEPIQMSREFSRVFIEPIATVDKNPVVDKVRTLIQNEGLFKELRIFHEVSGLGTSTLDNCGFRPEDQAKSFRNSISEHSEHAEVVQIHEYGQIIAAPNIIRSKKGKPYLGPLQMVNEMAFIPVGATMTSEGRMVGMLPVRGTRQ